jgi:hypothetical protein
MASPFKIFRKNRKMAIAVLGIMTMIAFVLLPNIMQMFGSRNTNPQNPYLVKTKKFGSLRASDLSILHRQRQIVLTVLSELMAAGVQGEIQAAMASGKTPREQLARLYPLTNPVNCRKYLENRMFGPAQREYEVNSWLLAEQAKQMGIVVSDDVINDFLSSVAQRQVPEKVFKDIFKRANVTDSYFFKLMQDELLALKYRQLYDFSVSGRTPAERWDCFLRAKRLATIEAIPVAVTNYVANVEKPKEKELKDFFEKYKAKPFNPYSPDPGFYCPEKIILEYFSADTEKFASPEAVSEKDIEEYYAKKNEFYDQFMKKPEVKKPAGKDEKGSTKDTKAVEESKDMKAPEEPKDVKAAEEPKDVKDTKAAEEPKDAKKDTDAKPSTPGTDANKSPEPKEEKKADPAEEKKENEKAADSKKSSAAGKTSPFVLTSLLQEEKKSPEAKPEEKPEAKPEAKPEEKPESKPEAKPEEKSDSKPEAKPEVSPEAKPEVKPEEKPETKPGEKAKDAKSSLTDELKKRIRRDIAQERIIKIYEGLSKEMNKYGQEMNQYKVKLIQATAKGTPETAGPAPAKLDFAALAKKYGLTSGSIGPVSSMGVRGSAIGDSYLGGRPVWMAAFQTMKEYEPKVSEDLKGYVYLLWVTQDVKEHEPKFDDPGVMEDVLHEWKMIHAREDTLKHAKSLADEATKAGKPLKQVFGDRPDLRVLSPTPFTWMTTGNVDNPEDPYSLINTVTGVESPGQDFMRAVFRLKPGEVGVAMNAPKTVAYVIRLTEYAPPYEDLLKQFEEVKDFGRYYSTYFMDQQERYAEWLKGIKEAAGFEWAEGQNPEHVYDPGTPEPIQSDDGGDY